MIMIMIKTFLSNLVLLCWLSIYGAKRLILSARKKNGVFVTILSELFRFKLGIGGNSYEAQSNWSKSLRHHLIHLCFLCSVDLYDCSFFVCLLQRWKPMFLETIGQNMSKMDRRKCERCAAFFLLIRCVKGTSVLSI